MGRLFAVEIVYRGIFQKKLATNLSRAIVLAAHKEGKPGISFGRYGDSPERNGIPAKSFAIVASDDLTLEEGMAKYEPKEVDITIAADLLRLVLRHPLLERQVVGGDDGEALRRDAVALRAVAVTPEGDPRLPLPVRREHDGPAQVLRERLLEDAPVDDLHCIQPAHRSTSAFRASSARST